MPVLAVVAGAFHPESTWEDFLKHPRAAGVETHITALTSTGNAKASIGDDVSTIREKLLLPLLDKEGKDVLLVLHSFAGFPGSVALKGLAKPDREAQGLRGGLLGVVYLAAFVPHEGDTVKQLVGGKWLPWQSENTTTGLLDLVQSAQHAFYNDLEDAKGAAILKTLHGHSVAALTTPCPPVAYTEAGFNSRRAYIRCIDDQALPISAQDGMRQASDVEWIVKVMNTSHSPFLSQPAALWSIVNELIGQFAQA